ncbi:MAG TPA: hypothetical protein DEF42_17845 [Desulfosporosinus sp.]|nr:hypothetical protein [Desulfosporosinus sp.]
MLKRIYQKYKSMQISDDRGGPQIYVLAAISIFLLLALYSTFGYVYKIQVMATRLHDAISTSAITALGANTVPDPTKGGIQVVDTSEVQQEFMINLQNNLKNWPSSSYTLQSAQVFSENDKGSSSPFAFSEPVPGTSIYLEMTMNIALFPGFIPMSNTHWSIPLHVMVSPNSYESSTGTWNLVRGT